MSRIFVHIGMPKCGSSFLQESLFPHLEERGAMSFLNVQRWTEPLRRLGFEDPDTFDPDAFRRELEPHLHPELTVVTCEWLSGSIRHKSFNRAGVARKLHAALPDAEIVLVLRAQPSLVFSAYKQYVHQGGIRTLRDYVRFDGQTLHDGFDHGSYSFDDNRVLLSTFDYGPLLDAYQPYVDAGRLTVLLFEQFQADGPAFTSSLLSTLGLDPELAEGVSYDPVNKGYDVGQLRLARRLNRLVTSPYNPYGLHLPHPTRWPEPLQAVHLRKVLQSPLAFRLLGGRRLRDEPLKDALFAYFRQANLELVDRLPTDLRERFRTHYLR